MSATNPKAVAATKKKNTSEQTPPMKNPLINYDEAAALFKAAGLPCSTRTVRRRIWDHPALVPFFHENYHTKLVYTRDVINLIAKLKGERNGLDFSASAPLRTAKTLLPRRAK